MNENRKVKLLIITILLGLLLASCGSTDTTGEEVAEDPLSGEEWELVSYGNPDDPTASLQYRQPTIIFDDPNVSGSTGCNNYWGIFTRDGENLQIHDIAVTEEFCDAAGVMDQEDEFLGIMNAVERVELDGSTLTLSGPGGTLLFGPPTVPEPQPIEGVLWQLEQFVSIEGNVVAAEAALEQFPITAWFEGGELSGSTGCNRYGVPYTIDSDLIEFTDAFFMTEAECLDEMASNQETRYVQALRSVSAFQVEGDTLILAFPGGELVYQSQPDPGNRESAVYEALLAEWGEEPFVIFDQTAFNQPGVSLEETLEAVQEQLSTMFQVQEDPFTLLDETLEDFRNKNAEPSSLEGVLQTRFNTIILTEAELQERFGVNGEIVWEAFEADFPGEEGVYSLSRVGFNATGDQALVYLGMRGEGLTGGWYSLMVKDRGQWMSTISFLIWEQ